MEHTTPLFEHTLEQRCFVFARSVRSFARQFRKDMLVTDDLRQLIRCSGSIGANYIEANENLGDKDLRMRIRISRKEAKEAVFWLGLLDVSEQAQLEENRQLLMQEAQELRKIFSAILKKLD